MTNLFFKGSNENFLRKANVQLNFKKANFKKAFKELLIGLKDFGIIVE